MGISDWGPKLVGLAESSAGATSLKAAPVPVEQNEG